MKTSWSQDNHVQHYDLDENQRKRLARDGSWYYMRHLLKHRLQSAGSVLDVGCAAGSLVPMLRGEQFAGKYCGIDFTPEFIHSAAARHPRELFAIASAAELPFLDASFDVVFCKGTLFVMDDPFAGVNELLRVAKREVIMDQILNLHGSDDEQVASSDRAPISLLGPKGITQLKDTLKGWRSAWNKMLIGLPQRQDLHPAYEKTSYLRHLVIWATGENR